VLRSSRHALTSHGFTNFEDWRGSFRATPIYGTEFALDWYRKVKT